MLRLHYLHYFVLNLVLLCNYNQVYTDKHETHFEIEMMTLMTY